MPLPAAPKRPQHPRRPGPVVALGASAGGLESLGRLLAGLPESFPAPILVVLHLDPHHPSQAVPLLQHLTRLPVQSPVNGARAKAGTVYVAPPDHHLELHAGKLRLTHAPRVNYSRPSIDLLFASVAADCGPAAIVAVLSGTGSDGAAGLSAVKARGGIAVAEDASTARFPGMPQAAARTGLLDAVLPVGQIPAFLLRALARRVTVSERQWQRVLALLESRTGTKFSRYRSTTLHRRLQHRLATKGYRTMTAYLRRLETDPAEVGHLQAAFLIKVSSFLRDPASWRALARELAPLASRRGNLRAWSAGCATGEEAYTMALLLARILGSGPGAQWKVFATDLDEGALKVARAARYSDAHVRGVSRADLARYFVREGAAWRVGKELRDRVVFGRHDLLHDPPLARMDLLACRNVLMYFTPEEKQRTLHRLSFGLNPGGILFLGRSDAMGPVAGFGRVRHTTLFRPKSLHEAMQTKNALPPEAGLGADSLGGLLGNSPSIVAVAVDAKGKVLLWNRAAEAFFGTSPKQALGKPLASAVGEKAARQLQAAMEGRLAGQVIQVECDGDAGPQWLEVECLAGSPPAAALFLGTEARPKAKGRRARPTARARSAEETPLSVQQDLNDELQSRNEELETVNEELQSLNDEMSAMEEQMRGLGEESRRANDFLRLLLDTSPDILIACDADNHVAFWNKAAIKRFRLSPAQAVGNELFELVPVLDFPALRTAARKVRKPGRAGRVALRHDGIEYLFDSLPPGTAKRRGYLLRVRPKPS